MKRRSASSGPPPARTGSLALNEIKAAGGMTVVQAPDTAQHDGMPRSAIAISGAEYVLPVEEMPAAPLEHVRRAAATAPASNPASRASVDPTARAVALIRARTKSDFGGYKKATLRRRIQRRMRLRHLDRMSEYVDQLRDDPAEVGASSKDVMIGVTSFFRDPAVTNELRNAVVFAPHRLLGGPPLSRLDLISCRHLFIYLEPAAQGALLPLLHFALVDGGYLFLGSAEGVGTQADLFETASARSPIYRRIGPRRRRKLSSRSPRSRSVIDAHHGQIWVTQARDGGRGTAVAFPLPLHGAKAARRIRR